MRNGGRWFPTRPPFISRCRGLRRRGGASRRSSVGVRPHLALHRIGKPGEQRQADFIDVIAWRQSAEFVSKYFSRGSMAIVSGRLQIREWQDKEGNKRRTAEINADNVYFGESKKSDGDSKPRPAGKPIDVHNNEKTGAFSTTDNSDGDLPF